MKLVPKNWHSFQHYKNRAPPWIKLHRGLLDDFDFQCLPISSKALAPLLWLIASESQDGIFDGAVDKLAFRLRMSVDEVDGALSPLIERGFFVEVQVDSNVLAERRQVAVPETEERRGEKEREADASVPLASQKPKSTPTPKAIAKTQALIAEQRAVSPAPMPEALQKFVGRVG